jgi:uncharacterized protein
MLQKQIENDYLAAFKAQDRLKVDVLRLIKAALKNAEIELRQKTLEDDQVVTVLAREAKRRRESITMFQQGGRADLVASETAELIEIEKYLPAQLSDEELGKYVTAAVAELQPTPKDFGKVMAAVMAKVKGQADGNRVSAAVKQQLH